MPSGLETFDAQARLKCSITDRMGRLVTYADLGGYFQTWSFTLPSNVEFSEIIAFSMNIYGPGSMWGYAGPAISVSGRTATFTTSPLTFLPAATWRCFVMVI